MRRWSKTQSGVRECRERRDERRIPKGVNNALTYSMSIRVPGTGAERWRDR